MVVIPQTAKCHRNQGTDSQPWSRRHLGVWHRNRDQKRGMYSFFDAVGPILIMPYRCNAVYTPLSGESMTWLVSNCDVTAGLRPLRYIFMWIFFNVWLYRLYHNGNHNKTCSKCLAYIDLEKYWRQYFGWICWYLQSNPILRINFTLF